MKNIIKIWTLRSGLIDAPVTGVAYADKILTFTGSAIGDRIAKIELYNQVRI
jgi:hypothetical protein